MTCYAILTMTLTTQISPIFGESGQCAFQGALTAPALSCHICADAARLESTTSTCNVLILEDDPATQEVFSLLLAPEEGFQVDCVSEVSTCLEYLRATSAWSDSGSASENSTERLPQPPFDVVLLDVRPQGRHRGTEVFAAAQRDPELHLPPMVICTALVDRALATIVQGCRAGLLACNVRVVLKPFDRETLTTELRRAARSRRAVLAST